MRDAFVRWWRGKEVEDDPSSGLVFVFPHYELHWTARLCHALVTYGRDHHRWLTGTAIAVVALIFANRR